MRKLSINMDQMSNWNVDSDNIRFYDTIMRTGGKFLTLDERPYVEYLCEFNIFFTLN